MIKMIPPNIQAILKKQHYKLVGKHSAVKLCHWLKKSLRNGNVCYKEVFYPEYVKSHTCLQMTASISCCNSCLYCWRIHPKSIVPNWDELKFKDWDEPKFIIEGAIKAQRLLLSGFPGWEGTNMKKWEEAQNPRNAALSLTGESLLYPKISELIEEFQKRKIITFLVTNGQFPERLENMTEPTQLYISLDAPNKEIYKKIDRPTLPDFWKRLNRSLELMNSLSCRKVIRLTMIKNLNMIEPEKYAKLIEKASPQFIEVKGYMAVGFARLRLGPEYMPNHIEIKEFSEKISNSTGYKIVNEKADSRVVLLKK